MSSSLERGAPGKPGPWLFGVVGAAISLVGGLLLARPHHAAPSKRSTGVATAQPGGARTSVVHDEPVPSAASIEPLPPAPVTAAGSVLSWPEAPPSASPQPLSTPAGPLATTVPAPVPAPLPPVSAASSAPIASSERPPAKPTRRQVSLARLSAWSKPGLCSTSEDAEAVRERLTADFSHVDADAQGQLYLDPRLPLEAGSALVPVLARAQLEVTAAIGSRPEPPSTFVYFDARLMKAAACINEDVVAFYDGALHLVAGRDDLRQSVTHELTHHALFAQGLIAPAWAQEGIAMLVARESWWAAPSQLQAVLRDPFSAEEMDELIPYKLPSQRAVIFYVQSALTVDCLRARRGWSLAQLVAALLAGSSESGASYDFPELQGSTFLRDCANTGHQLSR